MNRLNCWLCTVLAAFFCFAFLPRSAFADDVDRSKLNAQETMEQLGKDFANLHGVVLRANTANTKTAADDTLGGKRAKAVSTQVAPSGVSKPQALTLEKVITLDRHTPSLYRYWQRQDTIYTRTNPWGDGYCRAVTVRGAAGYACDAPIWKHLSRGTVLFVPAGAVFAKVPHGMKAPEAIALSPVEGTSFLAFDTGATIVAAHEKETATLKQEVARQETAFYFVSGLLYVVLTFLAVLLFAVLVLAHANSVKKRMLHEQNEELTHLKRAPPTFDTGAEINSPDLPTEPSTP